MAADPYQQLVQWWNAVRGSGEWQQYMPDLHTGERAITHVLGVKPALDYAADRPAALGYPDSLGEEKALRHLLLAAELHRTAPWLADPLLYGHEYITNVLSGQSLNVRYKDLHNNALGKYIGQRSRTRADAEAWAQAALPFANTIDYSQPDRSGASPPGR